MILARRLFGGKLDGLIDSGGGYHDDSIVVGYNQIVRVYQNSAALNGHIVVDDFSPPARIHWLHARGVHRESQREYFLHVSNQAVYNGAPRSTRLRGGGKQFAPR